MIKATVRYTSEHYKALVMLTSSKKIFMEIAYRVLLLFVFGYFVYCGIVLLKYSLMGTGVVVAVIGMLGIFDCIKGFRKISSIRTECDEMPPADEIRSFIFSDDFFTQYISGEFEETQRRFTYEGLHHAVETDGFFFVFIQKNLACIIAKKDIVYGTSDELSEFLRQKFGKRFTLREGGKI